MLYDAVMYNTCSPPVSQPFIVKSTSIVRPFDMAHKVHIWYTIETFCLKKPWNGPVGPGLEFLKVYFSLSFALNQIMQLYCSDW